MLESVSSAFMGLDTESVYVPPLVFRLHVVYTHLSPFVPTRAHFSPQAFLLGQLPILPHPASLGLRVP